MVLSLQTLTFQSKHLQFMVSAPFLHKTHMFQEGNCDGVEKEHNTGEKNHWTLVCSVYPSSFSPLGKELTPQIHICKTIGKGRLALCGGLQTLD